MRILSLVGLLLMLSPVVNGQRKDHHKQKNSTSAGTMFFYWGYNRSYYTKSDIRFIGSNYDFTLKNSVAYDRPDAFKANVYFNPKTITVPQYNARFGFYLRDKWAVSIGVDHFKYVFANHNNVLLDGYIEEGIDSTWGGKYSNETVLTDDRYFHYENTNGCNFLRVELMRSFDLFEAGRQRQFALTANLGVSTGAILSFNDLKFAQERTQATPSISGYGFSVNGGIRAEFFRHFFLQMNSGLGVIHQVHVRTRPNDRNQFARQLFGYSEYNAAAGVLFYIRSKNGCDTCPVW